MIHSNKPSTAVSLKSWHSEIPKSGSLLAWWLTMAEMKPDMWKTRHWYTATTILKSETQTGGCCNRWKMIL